MRYKVLIILMVIALMLVPLSCVQPQVPPQDWVVANETEFLAKCEHCNMTFNKATFGNYTSYYHQRMIGDAYVELDGITYIFSNVTGEFIDKRVHWRDDLPDTLPEVISKEEALTIGGGTKAVLVYIDPESSVSLVEPTPKNPCWEVLIYKTEGQFTYNSDVVVVDAVTGEILGHASPMP